MDSDRCLAEIRLILVRRSPGDRRIGRPLTITDLLS
jgi:hypothetical protein